MKANKNMTEKTTKKDGKNKKNAEKNRIEKKTSNTRILQDYRRKSCITPVP